MNDCLIRWRLDMWLNVIFSTWVSSTICSQKWTMHYLDSLSLKFLIMLSVVYIHQAKTIYCKLGISPNLFKWLKCLSFPALHFYNHSFYLWHSLFNCMLVLNMNYQSTYTNTSSSSIMWCDIWVISSVLWTPCKKRLTKAPFWDFCFTL